MTSTTISPDLVAFLRDEIESFEEMELLALLASRGDAVWTAEGLSRKLGLGADALAEVIAQLRARNLVDVRADGPYTLAGRALANGIAQELARVYTLDRPEIMRVMTAHALDRARGSAWRAFADAFVLGRNKKGDGDG